MPETANSIPNEVFLGRFVNDIVEDKETLNEATVPQVSSTGFLKANITYAVKLG